MAITVIVPIFVAAVTTPLVLLIEHPKSLPTMLQVIGRGNGGPGVGTT